MQFKSWIRKKRQVLSLIHLGAASLALPATSHAATIEGIINKTVAYLQGSLAKAVGILAIVIVGYLCLWHQKFPQEVFISVLIGLGIIFGASTLYSAFI